jgi:uncharacterized protein
VSGRAIFVDSSGWIALLHNRDSLHPQAKRVYDDLMRSRTTLVTTSLVLVEVAGVLAAPHLRGLAAELERRYRQAEIDQLVWIDENAYRRGWHIYCERSDKEWSLVDCISFVIMRDLGLHQVFGADHHFIQAGFQKLL